MICTPAGARVEPEVYCRYAMVSLVATGSTQVEPTSSGIASTAMTRGRSLGGRFRKNLRTPSAQSVVVSTADGWQSSRTACRRPAWPASLGSNNGTEIAPA
ncbi:Uncharacterised protein [Mycobacteroides abscessus subsp. massiliense]|nr:Uncharacterised protein [Mycobacteroides abscessus subsp. massiliense]